MPDDFNQAFSALQQGSDAAQANRQQQMKGARAGVESALDQPKPPVPDQPQLPDAPQPNFGKDAMQWLAVSAVMAGISGALTRRHATNALSAFSGAINGYRQGKMDVFEQQYKTWQAENQRMLEASRELWQRRDAILQDRKLNIDEKMARLQLIDSETGDQVGYQTAQMKNFLLYTHNQDLLQNKITQLELQTERLQAAHDKQVSDFTTKMGMPPDVFQAQQKDILATLTKQKPPGMTDEQWMGSPEFKQAWDTAWQQRKLSPGAGSIDDGMVAQRATGEPTSQIIGGWGGTQTRTELNRRAIELIKQQNPGMSDAQAGAEMAMRDIEYRTGTRSLTQLNTMLGATKAAVNQLDFNIKAATDDMNKLGGMGSTDLMPIFNAIARKEEEWTGDPKFTQLYFHVHAAAMESARLLSSGQASIAQLHDSAATEAQKWANVNLTPAQWVGIGQAMSAEGQERVKNYTDAINSQRGRMGGGANTFEPSAPEPAAPAPTAVGKSGTDGWGQLQVQ